MFSHVRVGSGDVEKSRAFYDAVLAPLGIGPATDVFGMLMYRDATNVFMVAAPRDGAPTHANGGTIGFNAADDAAVDAFHAAGLANGGSDEGSPGKRPGAADRYVAYLRDPDGNKIAALVVR